MISQPLNNPIITVSVKVYQALLLAYPTKFQQEYSSQMLQVFQDCCLRALRQGGTNGMFRLWAVALLDLIQSVISEHAQKEIEMKKKMDPEAIRMTGWALMWGGITFIPAAYSTRQDAWGLTVSLFLLSMTLLVVGMFGLRNRYGEMVGSFGKNILLIGAVLGSLTMIVGLVGGSVDPFWLLIFASPAVLFTCLALFGVVALYKKPLPRWNVLPLITGIWYPAFFFLRGDPSNNVTMALILLQCIALILLGYILKSDMPENTVAPA